MIPASAHFIWIGRDFPWLHRVALESAALHGGFDEVLLHHTDDLSGARWWRSLEQVSGVSCRRLAPEVEVDAAFGVKLVDRYRALTGPTARANVLRVALLLNRGGTYLDMDTVTVRSLHPERSEATFFCGTERIAFPGTLRGSKNPVRWGMALVRTGVRDLVRRSAHGVSAFRAIERLYPTAANNAVLGATRGHAFLRELGDRMLRLPLREVRRRYALGTALLQRALGETSCRGLTVYPPEVFYPLGPELSEHWFRRESRAQLADVLSPGTRVVHWYASVRTRAVVPHIDPAWLARQGEAQLLSALLRRVLGSRARAG